MKYIKEKDAPAEFIDAPYKRVIRHLAAPWTVGSHYTWVGTSAVEPGFTSNEHAHEEQEEIFYCIQGSGKIKVNTTVYDVEVGDLVYVDPGAVHQLINTEGKEIFKVISVVSPPFTPEKFKKDHSLDK